jgi:hypothetical protein
MLVTGTGYVVGLNGRERWEKDVTAVDCIALGTQETLLPEPRSPDPFHARRITEMKRVKGVNEKSGEQWWQEGGSDGECRPTRTFLSGIHPTQPQNLETGTRPADFMVHSQ